jgi:Amt family ammonium transporter
MGIFMKLRIPDEELLIGDVAVHGEEAYPTEELVRVGAVPPGGRAAPSHGNAAPAGEVSRAEP